MEQIEDRKEIIKENNQIRVKGYSETLYENYEIIGIFYNLKSELLNIKNQILQGLDQVKNIYNTKNILDKKIEKLTKDIEEIKPYYDEILDKISKKEKIIINSISDKELSKKDIENKILELKNSLLKVDETTKRIQDEIIQKNKE